MSAGGGARDDDGEDEVSAIVGQLWYSVVV